jgi:hypothetical protein
MTRSERGVEMGGATGVTEDGVDDVGVECEEGKDVGTTRGEVGGFDLGDTTNPIDETGQEACHAVVADTTKILETRTGEKVSGIGAEESCGVWSTSTGGGK